MGVGGGAGGWIVYGTPPRTLRLVEKSAAVERSTRNPVSFSELSIQDSDTEVAEIDENAVALVGDAGARTGTVRLTSDVTDAPPALVMVTRKVYCPGTASAVVVDLAALDPVAENTGNGAEGGLARVDHEYARLGSPLGSAANAAKVVRAKPSGGAAGGSPDQELATYQKALDTWRTDDFKGCIDQFTGFLQVYPASSYSDDAAYWLADCTYSTKEYKRAVVRFNAVVNVYPQSPKAPDALYRQGESLLKLGPKFHEAARTVFKRVEKEYPDSPRAGEAKRQLETIGAGAGPA